MHYYGAVMGPVAIGAAAVIPNASGFVLVARIALAAAGLMFIAYAVALLALFLFSAVVRRGRHESVRRAGGGHLIAAGQTARS